MFETNYNNRKFDLVGSDSKHVHHNTVTQASTARKMMVHEFTEAIPECDLEDSQQIDHQRINQTDGGEYMNNYYGEPIIEEAAESRVSMSTNELNDHHNEMQGTHYNVIPVTPLLSSDVDPSPNRDTFDGIQEIEINEGRNSMPSKQLVSQQKFQKPTHKKQPSNFSSNLPQVTHLQTKVQSQHHGALSTIGNPQFMITDHNDEQTRFNADTGPSNPNSFINNVENTNKN